MKAKTTKILLLCGLLLCLVWVGVKVTGDIKDAWSWREDANSEPVQTLEEIEAAERAKWKKDNAPVEFKQGMTLKSGQTAVASFRIPLNLKEVPICDANCSCYEYLEKEKVK
ncbi:hypothetical protein LCGC14_0783490 [marine sediment metagenome]|uniref:Uncharacterized protein n=1 Tax=marine sediment metagenome TaxID=412755 RepID=A0A0F9SEM1_9ZZZZ